MGFSNKSNNPVKYIKIMGLKKESDKHFFEVDGEEIAESNFEGKLIKISPSEYEYEGQMRQTMKLLFVDETHEYFQLDSSYNMLTRGLLNSLLGYIDSMKSQGKYKGKIILDLSLYLNKENYKQLGVRINGERASWRWDIEAQKAMIETITKKNGSKENDYFEYDEKLKSCIPEIQNFIEVNDFIDEHTMEPKAMDFDDYIQSINMETDTEAIKVLLSKAKKLEISASQLEMLEGIAFKRIEKLTNPAKSNRVPETGISIEDIPF